jgi:hypothetical protein
MKLSEVLKDKFSWTQRTFAMSANYHDVDPTTPTACKFCLVGAAIKVAYHKDPDPCSTVYAKYRTFLQECADELFGMAASALTVFNDEEATFEDIQKLTELVDSKWDYENWKEKE